MRRNRKRKKAMRHLQVSLMVTGLAALILFTSLIVAHFWLLAALFGCCALIGSGIAALLLRRRTQQREQWRDHVQTLNDLLQLTPTQFELITVELLRTYGFRHVRHTGGGGDLAADITCQTPQGYRAVVQCKRYAPHRPVGSPDIQKFIG